MVSIDKRREVFDAIDSNKDGTLVEQEVVDSPFLSSGARDLLVDEIRADVQRNLNFEEYTEFTSAVFESQGVKITNISNFDQTIAITHAYGAVTNLNSAVVTTASSVEDHQEVIRLLKEEYGPWKADHMGYDYGQNQTLTKKYLVAPEESALLEQFFKEKGFEVTDVGRFTVTPPGSQGSLYRIECSRIQVWKP